MKNTLQALPCLLLPATEIINDNPVRISVILILMAYGCWMEKMWLF